MPDYTSTVLSEYKFTTNTKTVNERRKSAYFTKHTGTYLKGMHRLGRFGRISGQYQSQTFDRISG
jgi:hypothetical protein